MKKETIEEASERAVKSGLFKDETLFIAGAKWQQEQDKNKYSQLDVVRILSKYETLSNEDFNKWFEQFKKK